MEPLQADPTAMLDYVNTMAKRDHLRDLIANAVRTQTEARSACTDYYAEVSALRTIRTWADDVGQRNEQFLNTVRSSLLLADTTNSGGIVTADGAAIIRNLSAAGLLFEATTALDVPESTYYGLMPTSGFAEDPVNTFNGNFVHTETDLAMPGLAAPLGFARTYNSLAFQRDSAFGPGWSCVLDMRLEIGPGILVVHLADGAIAHCLLPTPDTPQTLLGRNDYRISVEEDGLHLRHLERRTTWHFAWSGELQGFRQDATQVLLIRDGSRIVELREQCTGRSLAVRWEKDHVVALESSDGRIASYQYNANTELVRVDMPAGSYEYRVSGGLITQIIDADNVVLVASGFDATGRVTQQRSRFSRVTSYDYGDNYVTTITGDDGICNVYTHDERANLIAMTDGLGQTAFTAFDENGYAISSTDRLGFMNFYEHDADGRLIKEVNPLGESRRYDWDEDGRLVRVINADGHAMTFEYTTHSSLPTHIVDYSGGVTVNELNDHNLVTRTTDADGVVTSFVYNADGQLSEVRNAEGRIATFEYNAAGALIGFVDASGACTAFDADSAGRVLATRKAEAVATYQYSPAGRPVAGVEPGDCPWENSFGFHGELERITDAVGASIAFEYDSCGNQVAVVGPTGERYEQSFDPQGNLIALVTPDGGQARQEYDANGRSLSLTGVDGASIHRKIDVLGRTVAVIDPMGAVMRLQYCSQGCVSAITLPDGRTLRQEYDPMGRLITITEPSGATATTRYTPAGRVAERVDRTGKRWQYEYSPTGRCSAVTIDGEYQVLADEQSISLTPELTKEAFSAFRWDSDGVHFVGRTQLAPSMPAATSSTGDEAQLSGAAEAVWDRRGLLSEVRDRQGLATAITRDLHGWVVSEQFPNQRMRTYEYNVSGFVTSITDGGVETLFRRDAAGRVAGIRYADGSGWDVERDAVGRVTRRSDADGKVLNEFTYDQTGRMIHAVGRYGDSVEMAWDDDDNLIARIGGATPFPDSGDETFQAPVLERDASGRIIRDARGRIFGYDSAGRITQVINERGATAIEYGVDGLIAAEHTPDGTRRYQHDEHGRLIRLVLDNDEIAFTYDAAGRRVSEISQSGNVVTYRWNRAGELAQVCRRQPNAMTETMDILRDPLNVVYADHNASADSGRSIWGESYENASDGWWNGGYWIQDLGIFPERSYDARTHQWLSPDPLATVLGSPGSASAYTFNYFDPVNYVDPSGMRPLTQEEFDQWWHRESSGTFSLAGEALLADFWDTIAAELVVALGVALCFTPFAPIGAGILIGAGTTAAIGLATKTFSQRAVAVGGALGGIGAGASTAVESAFEGIALTFGQQVLVGAYSGGAAEAAIQVISGRQDTWQTIVATGLGGLGGGISGISRYRLRGAGEDISELQQSTANADDLAANADDIAANADDIAASVDDIASGIARKLPTSRYATPHAVEHLVYGNFVDEVLADGTIVTKSEGAHVASVVDEPGSRIVLDPKSRAKLDKAPADKVVKVDKIGIKDDNGEVVWKDSGSTMFPKEMSPEDVVDLVDDSFEARGRGELSRGGKTTWVVPLPNHSFNLRIVGTDEGWITAFPIKKG